MAKKSTEKLKYLENEKRFLSFFIIFIVLSAAKNCVRPESGLLVSFISFATK